jgi:hypothetical protein
MFLTGGSSPSAGSSSRIFFSVMVGKLLYASRVVNGPRKQRITVPGALPGLRSMLKGPLFQVCHDNVAMPSSLDWFSRCPVLRILLEGRGGWQEEFCAAGEQDGGCYFFGRL